MRKRVLLAGAAALALAGCGSNVKDGFVSRQWAEQIRELQIEPIFPPREDFLVGDVYLPAYPRNTPPEDKEDGYPPIATWLTSLELAEDNETPEHNSILKNFYKTRSTYPQTKFLGQQDPDLPQGRNESALRVARESVLDCSNTVNDNGNAVSDCNIFNSREVDSLRRLRIVGFPTFLATTITQGSLSAFVPAEAFTAALGLEFGDIESISVSVPVAESVGIPAMKLDTSDILVKDEGICDTQSLDYLLPSGQRKNGQKPSKNENQMVHAVVITEVFYTRAIDITIKTQESFGLGANVKPILPTSGKQLLKSETKPTGQTVASNGGQTGEGDSQKDPQPGQGSATDRRAQTTQQELQKAVSNLPTTPGVNMQLLSVADGQVGMRRAFARPLAIGYRGLSLSVDPRECTITDGGPAQDITPFNTPGQSPAQDS